MPRKFKLAEEFTSPELEQELLKAMIDNPQVYWQVLDLLPPEVFVEHRKSFEIMAAAIEDEDPLPTLEFNRDAAEDPREAATQLADLYQKRLLADLGQRFIQSLHNEKPATELIREFEDSLNDVQQAVKELRAAKVSSVSDLLSEAITEVEAKREAVREQGTGVIGLPTGIKRLDTLLGGLQPGLHLLAAEPGQGKTTFGLQIAAHVAGKGYPALFVSFEEALSRLVLKVVCQKAGLEAKRFADGYGDPIEFERAARTYAPELDALYLVEGTGRLVLPQLKAWALQLMNRAGREKCLLVIDYLQRWAAGRRDRSDFRHIVSGLVSELRELALGLEIPVLVISSQNRAGQGGSSLISLKESGDIEYSADTAMFLVESKKRNATPPARAVDLVVEKNRYGDKGRAKFIFKPDIGVFREEAKL